eukprot:1156027-Pelagomonas_calceolata.AAC.7
MARPRRTTRIHACTKKFGGGVPAKQYDLIKEDGLPVDTYIARVFDGVAENSHLRSSNYFYYNCMTGHFLKDNCPAYLKEPAFRQLKAGLIDRLTVETSTFLDELRSRKYTKAALWLSYGWASGVLSKASKGAPSSRHPSCKNTACLTCFEFILREHPC